MRVEGVEVDREVEIAALAAEGDVGGFSGGLRGDGPHLPPEGGGDLLLVARQARSATRLEQDEEIGEGEFARLGSGGEAKGGELGLRAPLVIAAEEPEVVGAGGVRLCLVRRGLGEDFTGLLREGALHDAAIEGDQDVFESEGIVEDADPATTEGMIDGVADALDLDRAPLAVDGALLMEAEQLVELGRIGSGTHDGVVAEALERGLAGFGMDVAVVPLGQPGLEAGVELLEREQLVALPDLALELLLEGPVIPLDDTPRLGDVGLGMNEGDAEVFAGAMEAVGLEGRAVVRVDLEGQAINSEQAAEAEANGGEVLVEVVAPLGDKARVVVDEGAQQSPPCLVVMPDAHVGAMVKIDDHQLEGCEGLDSGEGPAAKSVELAPGDAEPGEVAVECGASDLESLGTVQADQDVDDALGGALVLLAFAPEVDGSLQQLGLEGPECSAIGTPLGAQSEQPALAVGGEPTPDGAHFGLAAEVVRRGVIDSRCLFDRGGDLALVGFRSLGDDPMPEGGDLERVFVVDAD